MPGPVCKVIIDSGRLEAELLACGRLSAATSKMIGEAILRGALKGDDAKVAKVNELLCYWAEDVAKWNAVLFKLASEIAAQAPANK